MTNYISTGERMTVTAPSGGLTAGQVYVVGSKVCVVVSGGLEGASVALMTEGVFEIAKAVGAITIGQKLFFDNTNKVLTTVAAGNVAAGYAFKASASGDATGFCTIVDNSGVSQAALVAAISTANGSDLATTQALANATKTTVNAIQAALVAAGLMANA